MAALHLVVTAAVLVVSAYSVLKFVFFFVLPYRTRRAALDKSYAGRAYATGPSDMIMLAFVAMATVFLLMCGAEPIAFLGGLFVGATLIQMFFHAFHETPSPEREAPAPQSPLKRMSYAIQDRPQRAWVSMTLYSSVTIAAVAIYFGK